MTTALLTIVLLSAPAAAATPVEGSAAADVAEEIRDGVEKLVDELDSEDREDADGKRHVLELNDETGDISVHISGDHDDEIDDKLLERLTPEQLSLWLLAREKRMGENDNAPPLVATLVPLFFFLALAFVVGFPIYLRYRKHGQVQETVRMMVEKGAHIPPELLEPQNSPTRPPNDIRRGLILITLGVGLALCMLLVDGTDGAWGVGLVPLFVGIGYFLAGRMEQIHNGGPQAR